MKFLTNIIIVLLMTFTMSLNAFASAVINASDWAYDYVEKSLTDGLITESMASNAKNAMTRKEICSVALNFYKSIKGELPKSGTSKFTDYKSAEATTAVELGIMNGVSDTIFAPNEIVTREQIAVIVHNTILACGVNDLKEATQSFNDNSKISSWAIKSIYSLKDTNIISGYDNNFNPKDKVTIEQAVTIFKMAELKLFSKSTANTDDGKLTINGKSIFIGEEKDNVISTLGKPDRIDDTGLGFERYVYNSDYNNFAMVGIKEGNVVEIYSNSSNIQYKSISKSTNYKGILSLKNSSHENEIVETSDPASNVTIYLDSYTNFRVDAIRLADKNISYDNIINVSAAEAAAEKELFDIINSERAKYGVSSLIWDNKTASIAKSHSEVLTSKSSLLYTVNGVTPFDRLKNADIHFAHASENVSNTDIDPVIIYSGWLNDMGNRINIVDKQLTHAGFGCKISNENIYTTMDLYRP